MKSPIAFLIVILFVLTQACNQLPETQAHLTKTASQNNIPELLQRAEGVGIAAEQEKSANRFATLYKAIEANPENVESYLSMAELFMWEARITGEHGHYYPAALYMIETALEHEPTPDETFQGLSYKASVLLSLHQFDKAKKVAEQAVALNPHNAQIYGALVDAHVELGEYEKAVAMADKMVSIRPDLRSYSRISYLREIYGDVDGAIEAMNMAVKAGLPGTEEAAWTRLTLGNLYAEYGKNAEAKAQYEQILRERPDYPFATAALAELEAKAENYTEAEKLLKEAITRIPEVGFYHELALIYQKTGRKAEKEQLITEIQEMLKDDEAHGHKMGLEYASLHLELNDQPQKALLYALEEYEARPANIDVNAMLAKVYQKLGDGSNMKKHLEMAQVTNSKNPAILALVEVLD
ncbi:MAG: tetratricopeptide repeat protein [Bacteroidia bacterium]